MKVPKFPVISDYVPEGTELIEPNERSKFGYTVPELILTYGKKDNLLKNFRAVAPFMAPALIKLKKSYRSVKKNPAPAATAADPSLFRELEKYARRLGCRDIGYTEVPRSYVFSNKTILFSHAVVLTMEMDRDAIGQAPDISAGKEVWRTYRDLGRVVNKLAVFLRKKGYAAQPGPALHGDVNYPLLAQKAGMGRIGRHGMLISEGVGPRQRIAAVYTSIANLPVTDSDRHDWVEEWCRKCRICVQKCPAGAIFDNPEELEDGSRRCIDSRKCAVPFSLTMGCSVCIRDCAFNRTDYNRLKESFLGKA